MIWLVFEIDYVKIVKNKGKYFADIVNYNLKFDLARYRSIKALIKINYFYFIKNIITITNNFSRITLSLKALSIIISNVGSHCLILNLLVQA